jgi:tetratricopeptide (TPR) repeat protein
MTYGQLASAAAGGLILPFIGSAHQDVLSGWNRLWLVFGGGLVLLSAVQAFRKWRFEQEGSYRNAFARVPRPAVAEAAVESTSRARRQLWRYLPLAVIVVGGAFIAFTAAGKRLAQTPGFWSVVIVACGGWSLFTVAQGFAKGQIEPFARGFYNTYQRDTQPKRFWASMAWNAIFGCLCLWMAYQMNGQMAARALEGQCFDQRSAHVPSDDLAACNKLIEKRPSSSPYTVANLLVARGIAYRREGEYRRSLEDFSEAIHLEPNYSLAYYDRAIMYRELGDKQRATSDFEVAFRLDPKLLKSLQ